MTRFVRTLSEIHGGDLPVVGGKGANLGELTRAGFPVPAAFCVTTAAYEEMIDAHALERRIEEILESLNHDDAVEIERRGERVRALITQADIPADIGEAIRRAYAGLGSHDGTPLLVSVRSSATAEDLPGMSFAGQQDTYLNISGLEDVLTHIRRCWASLWTGRAISYRHKHGFRHGDVSIAVVVQEMFPSQVAGVLFTANPVTSNPNEIFVNASWGLGEAIVSGKVNPDQYILDKKTLSVTDRIIADKAVMTVRGDGNSGSREVEVAEKDRRLQVLADAELLDLGRIGLAIEKHCGFFQDIEWGYADGKFAILQAREVTAADLDFGDRLEAWQTPAAFDGLTDEKWLWSRAYSDEVQTGPTTPLFYTEIQSRTTMKKVRVMQYTEAPECLGYEPERLRDIPYFRWYGARAYYNADWEIERIRQFIPPFARDESALWPFPADQRENIKNMPFNWIRFAWIMLKLHVTNPKISLAESTHHLYANLEKWTAYETALWDALDLDKASTKEILATREKAVANSGFRQNIVLPFTIYLYVLPATLKLALKEWCHDDDASMYDSLVAGIQTLTSQENVAVWTLSREVKASGRLMTLFSQENTKEILDSLEQSADGRKFRKSLDEFLKTYGHRGAAERDPIYPRWRHKPELVFHSIKPMLALGDEEDPRLAEERLIARMKASKEKALKRAAGGMLGFVKVQVLKWLIATTQDYIYYRDFERFHNDKTMSVPRDIYLAIARKFVARGLIEKDEDIFFLGREEVVEIDDGQLTAADAAIRIRARRRVYEKYSRRQPPKYLRGWKTFDDAEVADDGRGLVGIAASSGVATGRARVCRSLEEISKVEKGDILVTVATDPGWTTVFSMLAGVVVETGGVIAHAVMISREYGVPCVANLGRACDLIPDGATITVDGTNGRVIIHDAA